MRKEGRVPSMVPHLVFLPSSLLPLTWYSWSLPTTANGIISCSQFKGSHRVQLEIYSLKFIKNESEWTKDDSSLWKGISEHKWGWQSYNPCHIYLPLKQRPYPDLLVDHSVLCILVKFFLRVHVNPIGSQLFPDLVTTCSNKNKKTFYVLQF